VRGPRGVALAVVAVWAALAIVGGSLAGSRHARQPREGPAGPAWLALPLPPPRLRRHLRWESSTHALWASAPAAGILAAASGRVARWETHREWRALWNKDLLLCLRPSATRRRLVLPAVLVALLISSWALLVGAKAIPAWLLESHAQRGFLVWTGDAALAVTLPAVNCGVTLFPRTAVAQRLFTLSLGLSVAASLMIRLMGWVARAPSRPRGARCYSRAP
jgi:hypothetical protein